MMSTTRKRIIWGVVGVAYAVVYGLWTAIATGGGHVNFVWIGLFMFVEFFGLYFPIMTILAVDLRSRITKIIFGSLIIFNLVASTIMILGWMTETGNADRASDFPRALRANGVSGIVVQTIVHFLPTMVFVFILIRSILYSNSETESEGMVHLELE